MPENLISEIDCEIPVIYSRIVGSTPPGRP